MTRVADRATTRLPASVRAALAVLLGFVALIAAGTGLLATPLASADGRWTRLPDALFTSVSAASDTGLVLFDTADHWSFFGEAVIAGLIFLGGLGVMASATLAVLLGRRTTLEKRATVSDAFGSSLGSARDVIRGTIVFALAVQAVGALVLAVLFVIDGFAQDAPQLVWWSVFHSVSAFNNAGFDLVGGARGFTVFQDRPAILAGVAVIVVIGGLGFAIASDIVRKRRWKPLALETKIVLIATSVLIVGGALAIGVFEWSNPATLAPLGPIDKAADALFQSISPRSAGFNSLDMAALRPETDIVTIGLMFVGAASGSTAGGIKVNTLAVLVLVTLATAAHRDEPAVFGRRVAAGTIARALTVLFVSGSVTLLGSLVVVSLSSVSASASVFETVSAFGTVGMSLVGTATYDDAARMMLAACMFLGRLGPLALIILLFGRAERTGLLRRPEEAIRVG